jgi:hypothetical protein
VDSGEEVASMVQAPPTGRLAGQLCIPANWFGFASVRDGADPERRHGPGVGHTGKLAALHELGNGHRRDRDAVHQEARSGPTLMGFAEPRDAAAAVT